MGEAGIKDKILELFYDDLGARFTIHELSKRINISYSYVYRQIEDLKRREILIIKQQSGRKYCSPNYSNFEVKTCFVAISNKKAKEFFEEHDDTLLVIERLVSTLSQKTDYNLLSIILFGSLAKGTATKKSDIDLFILVPSKEKYDEVIETECVNLSRTYGVTINPVISEPTSLINMLKDKQQNVGKEVVENKIILFGAEKFWELIFEVIL